MEHVSCRPCARPDPAQVGFCCGMGLRTIHAGRTFIALDMNTEKILGLALELIFVAVLLAQRGCAQSATASITPFAVNASQGSVTTFQCSVTGAVALLWEVDNIVLSSMNRLIDRGITFSESVEESPGSFQSNLTIPATPENDGSVVQCLAVVVVGANIFSLDATYRVQGMS